MLAIVCFIQCETSRKALHASFMVCEGNVFAALTSRPPHGPKQASHVAHERASCRTRNNYNHLLHKPG